ncbi:MAG: FAD-binding oxidoreductase [Planctomycetes bacterium]|nr:FAD-binding oxidoreductase [Planctomycetota bacterium]
MTAALEPASADELAALLRNRPGRVRLAGSGSRRDRLPPADGAVEVRLHRLAGIQRLDAGDQTCSVEPGLPRERLDAALAEKDLELPCPGGGTLGGLFAHDPLGAGGPGNVAPRSLLLGLEGVLADGTRFRSGARVVKSVAGFDVHKLLVGSDGRLFAATLLHLRLRPRPPAAAWFRRAGLEVAAACRLFQALRAQPVPPAPLQLRRTADGCAVTGRFAGRAAYVGERLRALELPEHTPDPVDHLAAPAGGEVLAGIVLPSRLPDLLPALAGTFVLRGDGRFELAVASPAAADAALPQLAAHGAHARIAAAAPARRGRGTPLDPGAEHLLARLRRALDPDGVLA